MYTLKESMLQSWKDDVSLCWFHSDLTEWWFFPHKPPLPRPDTPTTTRFDQILSSSYSHNPVLISDSWSYSPNNISHWIWTSTSTEDAARPGSNTGRIWSAWLHHLSRYWSIKTCTDETWYQYWSADEVCKDFYVTIVTKLVVSPSRYRLSMNWTSVYVLKLFKYHFIWTCSISLFPLPYICSV